MSFGFPYDAANEFVVVFSFMGFNAVDKGHDDPRDS